MLYIKGTGKTTQAIVASQSKKRITRFKQEFPKVAGGNLSKSRTITS